MLEGVIESFFALVSLFVLFIVVMFGAKGDVGGLLFYSLVVMDVSALARN